MNVRELIAELQKWPLEMPVVVWDDDAYDGDGDWVEVVQTLQEDGTTDVVLLTERMDVIEVPPEERGDG